MPQAEGECGAVSRRYRARLGVQSAFRPPPQSLRDSSPSGGAIESGIPLTTQCGQRGESYSEVS